MVFGRLARLRICAGAKSRTVEMGENAQKLYPEKGKFILPFRYYLGHEAQKVDIEFMEWLGISGVPFNIIFTKTDKLKPTELEDNLKAYETSMFESWETMPGYFVSSAEKGIGKDDILTFIDSVNKGE